MSVDHRTAVMLLLLALTLLAAACGAAPDETPAATSGGDASQAGAQESSAGQERRAAEQRELDASVADLTRTEADLVVWADEARSAALRPLAEAFADEQGVSVAVQTLPFEQIRDQFQVTAPEGEGPDVLIGAHEWLGEFVPAGMVAPVELGGRATAFEDVAVSAVTYDGRTYAVPYAVSSVALLRNTEQVPTPPGSWDDLARTVRDLRGREAVRSGLVLPGDPYHLYPVVSAFGGYLFGSDADGYDPGDLGLDSPGSLEAARRLQAWASEGVIEVVASSAEAQEQFFAGDAAFALLDPDSTDEEVERAAGPGAPYAVSPVPPVEGGTARPFVRVEAVMVSAFAADDDLARRFALDSTAADEGQAALAKATGRPPAHRATAEAAADDTHVAGFAASARDGVALPAIPETGTVWGPWAEALDRVLADGEDPRRALPEAAEEVRALIGR